MPSGVFSDGTEDNLTYLNQCVDSNLGLARQARCPEKAKTHAWTGTSLGPLEPSFSKTNTMIYLIFSHHPIDVRDPQVPMARVMYCSIEIFNASTAGVHRCTFAILS
jgi:hypothetical protein